MMFVHRHQGHTQHLHAVTLQRDGRQASEAEVKDLGVMLSQRGVMQIPACVLQTAQKQPLGERQPGEPTSLSAVARAHRTGRGKKPSMGLRLKKRPPAGKKTLQAKQQAAMANGKRIMDEEDIKRPIADDVYEPDSLSTNAFSIYVMHATTHCHGRKHFVVYDLGAWAARRGNACFWLAFAAAWASLPQAASVLDSVALPKPQDLRDLLDCARCQVKDWASPERARGPHHLDAVGLLADGLRQRFCAPGGYAHSKDPTDRFAALWYDIASPQELDKGCSLRRHWLYRVATAEVILEEIVPTVSMALNVRIVVVPPKKNQTIQVFDTGVLEYPQPADVPTVYLATDDFHYVWLRPQDDGNATAATAASSSSRHPILPVAEDAVQ